jgi:transcriptional regulator with XRE-family HTH domain
MMNATLPIGDLLRDWRQRRRLSQLALAAEAELSPRHLSFIETGRSRPSRAMLVRLMERLEVPLRERNLLLHSAGFAALYPERSLDDVDLTAARRAVDLVLAGHEPNPALAVDRAWNLVAMNRAVRFLIAGVDPELLAPPVNVLRLSLHPAGLAPRIVNLNQWREHLFARLRHEIERTADARLADLLAELGVYPSRFGAVPPQDRPRELIALLRLQTERGEATFFSTTMLFGAPSEVTLSELAIESFFPADHATAAIMRSLAAEMG